MVQRMLSDLSEKEFLIWLKLMCVRESANTRRNTKESEKTIDKYQNRRQDYQQVCYYGALKNLISAEITCCGGYLDFRLQSLYIGINMSQCMTALQSSL